MHADPERTALTPRAAGIAVLVASVVLGVLSALFLTSPGWGLLAAGTLSIALAGGGLGVVWMSRTTWGPEPRPERHDRREGEDPRRARRSALIYGIVVLTLGAGGVVAIAWAAVTQSFRPEMVRITLFAVVAAVLGVVLIKFARSPIPAADQPDDEAPPVSDDHVTDEWLRLSRRDRFVVAAYSIPSILIMGWVLLQLGQLSALLSENPVVAIGVAIVLAGAVFVGAGWWMLRRYPEVWANPATRRIRLGSREADWKDLRAAKVSTVSVWPGAPRTLFLTLEGEGGLRVPLTLRRRDRLALTGAQRELAIRLITDSNVEMPRAPEDPDGRFSRFNFPEHISRDDAIALVTTPPRAGERLPVPYV